MADPWATLPATPAAAQGGSEEGRWPRASVGFATLANHGKGSENQDSYVAIANGSKCFVGVFDGHGHRGKRISEFAKDTLSRALMDSSDLHTDPRLALEQAYQATQRDIERRRGLEAAESGTTAVTAYLHRDRLFVANLGDSRAVLGRCDTDAPGTVCAVELSVDQKPCREDERKRIIAAGGRVDRSILPMHTARGGVRWVRVGPERVMTREGTGGLAMSRSFGDLRLRPAVIAVPELQEKLLDSRDKVLVVGSDGVWDHMTSQEVVDMAARRDNPTVAAREIAEFAKKRWQQATEGQVVDDITAVVVRFDFDHCGSRSSTTSGTGARPSSSAWRSTLPDAGGARPSSSASRFMGTTCETTAAAAALAPNAAVRGRPLDWQGAR